MVVDVRSLTPDQVEELTGRLVWDEVVVDLCNIHVREVGGGFVHVRDVFGTDEGCGANLTVLYDAFDAYGMPTTACLTVEAEGVEHEYCAPLNYTPFSRRADREVDTSRRTGDVALPP